MLKTYYFDAAAHEPPSPAALDAFQAALPLGNPSALHACGVAAKIALEEARASIAQDLNCLPEEVYFTSGATEACNWMMESLSAYTGKLTYPRRYEHHAVLEYPPVDHPHRTDRPGLTHMMANNETGEIFDIHSIRRNAHNALFACDATAAVGQIPVDFKALGVDYLAFGAHKFGGISGIGCLIVKKDAPLLSMIRGGGQEWGKRGGTESVALACAMAAALHDRMGNMLSDMKRIARCRDLLISYLLRFVPDTYVTAPIPPVTCFSGSPATPTFLSLAWNLRPLSWPCLRRACTLPPAPPVPAGRLTAAMSSGPWATPPTAPAPPSVSLSPIPSRRMMCWAQSL